MGNRPWPAHTRYTPIVAESRRRIVDRIAELASQASEGIAEARALAEAEDRGLVEFVIDGDCPVRSLAARGAVPTTVEGTPGGGRIVAEIMPGEDPSAIVDAMLENHAVELVAKRTRTGPAPLVGGDELRPAVLERLTDRQREVLQAAHGAGYYERPRRNTGEEITAELGISPTTFQEHVRTAERKLVTFLVEED